MKTQGSTDESEGARGHAKSQGEIESGKEVVIDEDAKAEGENHKELCNLDGDVQARMDSDIVCGACYQLRWADMDESVSCKMCRISRC